MTVKVEGLSLLRRNLRKVNSDYPKEMKEIHKKVAEPVAAKAKGKVRSRSGKLASTIRPSATQRSASIAAGARIKYAGVNHWGWPGHNITGNPFLTDAIGESERQIVHDYERLTGAFIERVWTDNFA